MKQFSSSYWIEQLGLQDHPEGGFFRETYRSDERLAAAQLPQRYDGARAFGTAIYFMLTARRYSSFHRLQSDEIWHFHDGDPLDVHFLHPDGRYTRHSVGLDPERGIFPQLLIPRLAWFAAQTTGPAPEGFSLISCTVAPGFDFADFELADTGALQKQYPEQADLIECFAPPAAS